MKYQNSRQKKFIENFPSTSIESNSNNITQKCKFNFSYYTEEKGNANFEALTVEQLLKLLHKLKDYSRENLSYWKIQPIGHGKGRVLKLYDRFPPISEFDHPRHVPFEVVWGRFRLEDDFRLAGFVIPTEFHGREHQTTREKFDCNTFYVVFIDPDHQFCP
jgi:hypothetical protein